MPTPPPSRTVRAGDLPVGWDNFDLMMYDDQAEDWAQIVEIRRLGEAVEVSIAYEDHATFSLDLAPHDELTVSGVTWDA